MLEQSLAAARPLAVLRTGHAPPGMQVLSTDLDRRLGLLSGSIESAGGVTAGPHETAASLGAEAARRALEMAKITL
jgi:3-oxoacyl-[acyl-carrier-protein] synthase-3